MVRPVSDGKTVGRPDGLATAGALESIGFGRICALSAVRPAGRPAGFFGGQRSDGATATIIMSTNAISRLRLSTSTLGDSLAGQGTGSYPPAWNGWHLRMRRIPSQL